MLDVAATLILFTNGFICFDFGTELMRNNRLSVRSGLALTENETLFLFGWLILPMMLAIDVIIR